MQFTIYDNDNDELKNLKLKKGIKGYVYICECGKNLIKIGSSFYPYQRMYQLYAYGKLCRRNKKIPFRDIKRIALSKPETYFLQNEMLLHNFFEKERYKGTEFFRINFDKAIKLIPEELEYSFYQENTEIEDIIIKNKINKAAFDLILDLNSIDGRQKRIENNVSLTELKKLRRNNMISLEDIDFLTR